MNYKTELIKNINNCLEALITFDEDAKKVFKFEEILKEDLKKLKKYRNN